MLVRSMENNNNNYEIMKKNVDIRINTNVNNVDNTKIPQVGEKEENVQKFKNRETAKIKQFPRENPLVFSSSKINILSDGHDEDRDEIPIVAPSTTHIESMKNKIALCNAHVLASTAGIARLKALIEKDALHLSLVIHEPEIWRR